MHSYVCVCVCVESGVLSAAISTAFFTQFTYNAGDTTVHGVTISNVPGHIQQKKIFVSPSILYCTYRNVYAKEKR